MSEGLATLLLPAWSSFSSRSCSGASGAGRTQVAQLQDSPERRRRRLHDLRAVRTITALDDVMATLEIAPGTVVRFDRAPSRRRST